MRTLRRYIRLTHLYCRALVTACSNPMRTVLLALAKLISAITPTLVTPSLTDWTYDVVRHKGPTQARPGIGSAI